MADDDETPDPPVTATADKLHRSKVVRMTAEEHRNIRR